MISRTVWSTQTCGFGRKRRLAPSRFDPNTSPAHVVGYLARRFTHALRWRLAGEGIRVGYLPALRLLWQRDARSQVDMADWLRVEQPTMARTLARMQRDGLIVRFPDDLDRRRSIVCLTERGRRLEGVLAGLALIVDAVAVEGLADEEAAQFLLTGRRMCGNLEVDATAFDS